MGRVYNNLAARDIAPHERERAGAVAHSGHISREASQARPEEVHPEIDPNLWINPVSLKAPPPRDGYVQRWISDGEGLDPAVAGRQRQLYINKVAHQGWKPRTPDTIPEHLQHKYLTSKAGGADDLIRVASLVLCEMPVQIARQRFAALNDVNLRQSQTLPDSLEQLRERSRGTNAELQVENTTSAAKGRRAATMANE